MKPVDLGAPEDVPAPLTSAPFTTLFPANEATLAAGLTAGFLAVP